MRVRLVASIAVPVIVFTLTLAVLLREQRNSEPRHLSAPAAASLAETTPVPHAPATSAREQVTAQDRETNSDSAAAAADEPPPAPDTRQELPVRATSRRVPGGSGYEVALANFLEEPLEITVLVTSADSSSKPSLQMTLAPGTSQLIGLDDGLDLQGGDQVTLQNPQFHDLVVKIR